MKEEKVSKRLPRKREGRPSIYTKRLGLEICARLSLGESLKSICKDKEFPTDSTVYLWLLDENKKDFSDNYARARATQAEKMFEDIIEIADASDSVIRSGAEKKSSAYAQNQRLKIDTRKWYLSKVLPKKFGDKLDVTSGGDKLPTPIYGGTSISGHHGNKKDVPSPKKD
jgi:hypothetical protein